MSLIGKLLAVANVLAALAFAFLAAADWGQRQAWGYGGLRMELALDGLPLDANATDPDGVRLADKISNATFQAIMQPVGGVSPPPSQPADRTQLAEVKRVHDRLRGEIDGLADAGAKRRRLAAILVPLAQTLDARHALEAQIGGEPVDKLLSAEGPFEKAFTEVLQGKNAKGQELSTEGKRQAVAHLLFNVAQNEQERQRAAVVVGLRALAAEADRQALALRDMGDRVALVLAQDRGEFMKNYQQQLVELGDLAGQVEGRRAELKRQQDLVERNKALLSARTADVRTLQADLEKVRQETTASLARLAKEQALLFQAQERVGRRLEQNLSLERQIRSLEAKQGERER